MAQHIVRNGVRMSLAAFRRLPEQPGLQLIDGIVVKEPSPTYGHQSCVLQLAARLLSVVEAGGLGRVIVAPFDVVLGEQVLQPDVMFVRANRVGLIQDDGMYGAPDLVVEVLSPSTRRYDLGRKRELYFAHGCRELWVVDVAARTLQRLTQGGAAAEGEWLTAAESIQTALLNGLTLRVAEVFSD